MVFLVESEMILLHLMAFFNTYIYKDMNSTNISTMEFQFRLSQIA